MERRATSSKQRLRRSALLCLLFAVVLAGGCKQKKSAVPPQAQAPAITVPEKKPAEVTPPPLPPTEGQPGTKAEEIPTLPRAKPKHRVARKPAAPAATQSAEKASGRVVVPQGGTSPTGTQLSPDLQPSQAIETRQSTAALLDATDSNLKGLTRQLTAEEQATVEQIRTYMAQSRSATTEGDLIRARNLAEKAHLLSEALVKHD